MRPYPPDYASWPREKQDAYFRSRQAEELPNGEGVPEFTEDRLALDFADRHSPERRYVAAWGKWLAWAGTHWEIENTLDVFDKARKICRAAAAQCTKLAEAKLLSKAKTVAAVEMLARADRKIAAIINQWDGNPSNFNTKE